MLEYNRDSFSNINSKTKKLMPHADLLYRTIVKQPALLYNIVGNNILHNYL